MHMATRSLFLAKRPRNGICMMVFVAAAASTIVAGVSAQQLPPRAEWFRANFDPLPEELLRAHVHWNGFL